MNAHLGKRLRRLEDASTSAGRTVVDVAVEAFLASLLNLVRGLADADAVVQQQVGEAAWMPIQQLLQVLHFGDEAGIRELLDGKPVPSGYRPIEYPALSAEDETWFEAMIARSLAGDRDWSDADRARYHDMLLGEYSEVNHVDAA